MTVGGEKLEYEGDLSSPDVSLCNTKMVLNSVISDSHKCLCFATADIKNHYLHSPMSSY